MNECDVEAFGTFTGSFVDKAAAFAFEFGESICHAVFNGESYVLNTAASTVGSDEFADGAVFGCTFKKLEFGLADFEESGANLLVCNFFNCKALEKSWN